MGKTSLEPVQSWTEGVQYTIPRAEGDMAARSEFRDDSVSAGREPGLKSPELVDLLLVAVHFAVDDVGDAH